MKKLVGVAAIFFLVATLGSAATLCTSFSGPQIITPTFQCSLGGLTFSNFTVVAAAGNMSPEVDLVSANTVGGTVNLNFNPNMSASTTYQDLYLFYTVSGGATSVGGTNAGANASIQETACVVAFDIHHICAAGSQLANFTIFSTAGLNTHPAESIASNTSVNIFKDIQVTPPGSLTSFTQTFGSNGIGGGSGEEVPEPVSLLLMGSGLVGLSLLKKVRNA